MLSIVDRLGGPKRSGPKLEPCCRSWRPGVGADELGGLGLAQVSALYAVTVSFLLVEAISTYIQIAP